MLDPAEAPNNAVTGGGAAAAVACKLPIFWSKSPAAWFLSAESNFVLCGITRSVTKFHHVLKSFDQATVLELQDLLLDETIKDDYDAFKTEVLKRFSVSVEQKLRELVSQHEIGDRTPSQFLRHLKNLAGKDVKDNMVRTLWADKLPPKLQPFVAQYPSMPLADLATLADNVYSMFQGQPAISAVAANATDAKLDTILRRLEVLEMSSRSREPARGRSQSRKFNSRARSRTPSAAKQEERKGLCYYHHRFGDDARNCRAPCLYKKDASNDAGRR